MAEKTHITKDFGKKLKSLRKQKKLSQVKLADRLGVHPTYISSLERGLRNPSLKVIDRIASALEINREILIKF
ncbi:XRE family transcriptional regulator [Candidatus Kuenenbacteria bacterium CG_4_10_14_3_um_filter_39_14]|uniref:XRE family transcriptional regulator n=1 Tax=Candidatus Kuenenbacteria bacterium CG_4_10_14_3_um_filter_39_14 TaxID=1974614 RepID=A0A2M7MFS2_9BACT|nr:MAG: XRE family transcriptional regulator [Candidatus Kuenenbacteria bacterium CG_4_10_14_3_um_filter_39_14]